MSVEITCGDVEEGPGSGEVALPIPSFGFKRKKRQTSTDTLYAKFNVTININFTECTEVNCQDKYDKLIQVYIKFCTTYQMRVIKIC